MSNTTNNNNNNNEPIDPRELGVEGIKGIKEVNPSYSWYDRYQEKKQEQMKLGKIVESALEEAEALKDPYYYNETMAERHEQNVHKIGLYTDEYGKSIYDDNVSMPEDLEDLEDFRARHQPAPLKIVNGIIKGVGLAGTTYINGTVGTVWGAGAAIATQEWNALYNNSIMETTRAVEEGMESIFPNYYTREERENYANGEWYKNMNTANFWGDQIIKNFGFTVGAYYSGGAALKALQKIHLVRTPGAARAAGVFFSGLSEGAIEASHAYNDFLKSPKSLHALETKRRIDQQQQIYNDEIERLSVEKANLIASAQYNEVNNPFLEETLANIDKDIEFLKEKRDEVTKKVLDKAGNIDLNIMEKAASVGNFTLALNCALLWASEYKSLGNLYARNFDDLVRNREATSRLRNNGARFGVEEESGVGQGIWDIVQEGVIEEGGQGAISKSALHMYSIDDPDAYAKAWHDPAALNKTKNIIESVAQGFSESYLDSKGWQEIFAGALTGGMGTLSFGKENNNTDDTWLGKNKVIGLRGGLMGSIQSAKAANTEAHKMADDINSQLENYVTEKGDIIKNLAVQQHFTDLQEGFIESEGEFQYNNKQADADFVLMQTLFSIGQTKFLESLVAPDYSSMSDDQIREQAASMGLTDLHGNPLADTQDGIKETRELLENNKEKMLKVISNYKKATEYVNRLTAGNENFDDLTRRELAWLHFKDLNFGDRVFSIRNKYSSQVNEAISRVREEQENWMEVLQNKDRALTREEKKKLQKLRELQDDIEKTKREELEKLRRIREKEKNKQNKQTEKIKRRVKVTSQGNKKQEKSNKEKKLEEAFNDSYSALNEQIERAKEEVENSAKTEREAIKKAVEDSKKVQGLLEYVQKFTSNSNLVLSSDAFKSDLDMYKKMLLYLLEGRQEASTKEMEDFANAIRDVSLINISRIQFRERIEELRKDPKATQERNEQLENQAAEEEKKAKQQEVLDKAQTPEGREEIANTPEERELLEEAAENESKSSKDNGAHSDIWEGVTASPKEAKDKMEQEEEDRKEKKVVDNSTTEENNTSEEDTKNTEGIRETSEEEIINSIVEEAVKQDTLQGVFFKTIDLCERAEKIFGYTNIKDEVIKRVVNGVTLRFNQEVKSIFNKLRNERENAETVIEEMRTSPDSHVKRAGGLVVANNTVQTINSLKDMSLGDAISIATDYELKFFDLYTKQYFNILDVIAKNISDFKNTPKNTQEGQETEDITGKTDNPTNTVKPIEPTTDSNDKAPEATQEGNKEEKTTPRENTPTEEKKHTDVSDVHHIGDGEITTPWKPDITEFWMQGSADNPYKPSIDVVTSHSITRTSINGVETKDYTDRQKIIFKILYNYILDAGGFNAVDAGEVSVGSTIRFVVHKKVVDTINKELEKIGESPLTEYPIFLVNERGNILNILATEYTTHNIGGPNAIQGGIDAFRSEITEKAKEAFDKEEKSTYVHDASSKVTRMRRGTIKITEGDANNVSALNQIKELNRSNHHDVSLAVVNNKQEGTTTTLEFIEGNGKFAEAVPAVSNLENGRPVVIVESRVNIDGYNRMAYPLLSKPLFKGSRKTVIEKMLETLVGNTVENDDKVNEQLKFFNSILKRKSGNSLGLVYSNGNFNIDGKHINDGNISEVISNLDDSVILNFDRNLFTDNVPTIITSLLDQASEFALDTQKSPTISELLLEASFTDILISDKNTWFNFSSPITESSKPTISSPGEVFASDPANSSDLDIFTLDDDATDSQTTDEEVQTPNQDNLQENTSSSDNSGDSPTDNNDSILESKLEELDDLGLDSDLIGEIRTALESDSQLRDKLSNVANLDSLVEAQDLDDFISILEKYRKASKAKVKTINLEKELKWFEEKFPGIPRERAIQIVENLIDVKGGGKAYGMYFRGIQTISEMAARGTLYHESFHMVFDLFTSKEEKESLLKEAKDKYLKDKTFDSVKEENIEAEEQLAEAFRRYVQLEEVPIIGKAVHIFRQLKHFIQSFLGNESYMHNLFYRINNAKIDTSEVQPSSSVVRLKEESYTQEMLDIKAKAIADGTFMKAPNGKPSNLNERQWLHVRTKAFKKWFGDWTKITQNEDGTWNIPDDVSKVVDTETGEPLVVYHGSLGEFSIFDTSKLGENTGQGYYTDHITGEKIDFDSSHAFFFTGNEVAAKSYKNLAVWQQNEFRKQVYWNLYSIFLQDSSNFIAFKEEKNKENQRNFIDNILSPAVGFDVRREANNITNNNSTLSKEQIEKYADLFRKMAIKLDKLPDARSISNQTQYLERAKSDLNFLIENKESFIKKRSINRLEDRIIRISGESAADSGISIVKEGSEYKVFGLYNSSIGETITENNFNDIISEWKRLIDAFEKKLSEEIKTGHYNQGNIYKVFLNIRNPIEHDYEDSPFPDKYKNTKYPTGYIAARQVKKALSLSNDGVIYNNVRDPFKMNSYGVFNSNQIKSATDNIGTYSEDNDDIMYREVEKSDKLSTNNTKKSITQEVLDIRHYNNKKMEYVNLSKERLSYLEENKISKEEYDSLTSMEKDAIFMCRV